MKLDECKEGQWVIYDPGHPGATKEDGTIDHVGKSLVRVKFWKDRTIKACHPMDLTLGQSVAAQDVSQIRGRSAVGGAHDGGAPRE